MKIRTAAPSDDQRRARGALQRGPALTGRPAALTVDQQGLRLLIVIQVKGGVDGQQQLGPVLALILRLPGELAQVIGAGRLAAFFRGGILQDQLGVAPGVLRRAIGQAHKGLLGIILAGRRGRRPGRMLPGSCCKAG